MAIEKVNLQKSDFEPRCTTCDGLVRVFMSVGTKNGTPRVFLDVDLCEECMNDEEEKQDSQKQRIIELEKSLAEAHDRIAKLLDNRE